MKVTIYKETKKDVPEIAVSLALQKVSSGIALVAVNEGGTRLTAGNIIIITDSGRLERCSSMEVPGLQTGAQGKIIVDD